jgi:hypothetical protein
MQVITERRKVKFSDKKHGEANFDDIIYERHSQSLPQYEVLPPHKSYFDLGVQSVDAYESARNRVFSQRVNPRLREIEFEVEPEEEVFEAETCGVADGASGAVGAGAERAERMTSAGEYAQRVASAEYAQRANTDYAQRANADAGASYAEQDYVRRANSNTDAELDYSQERQLPSEETMKQRLNYEGNYQEAVDYYGQLLNGGLRFRETSYSTAGALAPTAAVTASRFEEQRQIRGEIQGRISLNARSKITVAAYIALILTMLIVALITASSIAALSVRETELEDRLAASRAELSLLSDQSSTLAEDAAVYAKAADLGMYVPTGAGLKSVSLPSMKTQNEYYIKSNWFNAFCVWLSNLFGG